MRKLPIALVAALGASLLFSGCFFLRSLNFSQNKTKVDQPVTATIGLGPAGGEEPSFGLVVVASPGAGNMKLGPGRFDTAAKHGGPYKLVKQPGLEDALETDESCDVPVAVRAASARGPGVDFELLARRTEEAFVAAGPRKLTAARFELTPLTEGKGGVLPFVVFSGDWNDDGDGIPQDTEVSCTGSSTSSLIVSE